jgi:hypothetical protein
MIPVSSASIDYITWVTSAIDSLTASGSALFLSAGTQILTWVGVIMLVIYGLKWAAHSASRHHAEFDFPALVHFFGLFLVAEALMRYYAVPLPWTSSTVASLFPDTGRYFAGTMDLTVLNLLLAKIGAIIANAEHPSFWDPEMFFAYCMMTLDLVLMQGILFGLNILSFVWIGMLQLLGPLFIPWLIVPRLSFLFWNWLQSLLQYSFYRVVASGLTYIWATVFVRFIDNVVHADYSLAHLFLILVPLGMLNIGLLFCVVRVSAFVNDLFRGGSSSGGGLSGAIAGVVRGAFR